MKSPLPGEIVLTIRKTRDGEAIMRKALFVQHVDYPDQGWLDQQMAIALSANVRETCHRA